MAVVAPGRPSSTRPGAPDDFRSGGGSGWVPLVKASDDIDAHLLTGRLTDGGIETATVKERGRPGSWTCGGSDPWAPVTIFVRKFQLEEARLVLAEVAYDAPAVDPADIRGGGEVRWPLWWGLALTLGLAFSALGLAQAKQDIDRVCATRLICRDSPRP